MIDVLILAQGIPPQMPIAEVAPASVTPVFNFTTTTDALPPPSVAATQPLYGFWQEATQGTVNSLVNTAPARGSVTAQSLTAGDTPTIGIKPTIVPALLSQSPTPEQHPPELQRLGENSSGSLGTAHQTSGGQTSDPQPSAPQTPDPQTSQSQSAPSSAPQTSAPSPATSQEQGSDRSSLLPALDLAKAGVLELVADHQEYDGDRQWVTAQGKVYLRFKGGELWGDRVDLNLQTQVLRAKGNVEFQRGRQHFAGDALDYNLMQETGEIANVSGELSQTSSGSDLNFDQAAPPSSLLREPLSGVQQKGGIEITTGFGLALGTANNNSLNNTAQIPLSISGFRQQGTVTHWRFQASQVTLNPYGWVAERARLTNDPFNPPQFQLRTRRLRSRELDNNITEIRADRPRFVFDNGLAMPTFRNRVLLNKPQDAGLFTLGFDQTDRGGLYIERSFEPISTDKLRLNITPQFLIQNTFSKAGGNPLSLNAWGVKGDFAANFSPQTHFTGALEIPRLGEHSFENTLRANVRGVQALPAGHTLNLEYSYRDRLFNGSLGFQTVQQSLGAVLQSPAFTLGKTGIVAQYQGGAQWIKADTDRPELLSPQRKNNRVDLGRYQLTASLDRGISLWQGQALSDPQAALRYSPSPIVPNLSLGLNLRGIYGLYSNGDTQEALISSISINGNFGHFARHWFDYTQFNLGYSQAIRGHQSPFLFDRLSDSRVMYLGLTQQIYGPIRLGVDTAMNLDRGEAISTNYHLEYSRRAFSAQLSYNPVLGVGALNFRINNFDWLGIGEPWGPQQKTEPLPK